MKNVLLRIPSLINISCSLTEKLIEIVVKFFRGTKLKSKKRIYRYGFFSIINLEVGMGLSKKDSCMFNSSYVLGKASRFSQDLFFQVQFQDAPDSMCPQ